MNDDGIDIQELRKELGLKEEKLVVSMVSSIIPGSRVETYMNNVIKEFAELYSGAWLDDWKIEYMGEREFLIVMKFCWME